MIHPTLALIVALSVAACAGPERTATSVPSERSPANDTSDTIESRGAAAGLTRESARELAALSMPAAVPDLPRGWTFTKMEIVAPEGSSDPFPNYTIRYATEESRCVTFEGASEGIGDVFVEEPPRVQEVSASGLAHSGPILVGWSETPGTADGWDSGYVTTEWFGMDGFALRVAADDRLNGCRPASVADVVKLVRSLRPLDPAHDAALTGEFRFADIDLPDAPTSTARALADLVGASFEVGEGRGSREVSVLTERPMQAVALITLLNQADDSVRDQRYRVSMLRFSDGWTVNFVASQVRCQPGRGSQTWTHEVCR